MLPNEITAIAPTVVKWDGQRDRDPAAARCERGLELNT
jgi:hypothetical protein